MPDPDPDRALYELLATDTLRQTLSPREARLIGKTLARLLRPHRAPPTYGAPRVGRLAPERGAPSDPDGHFFLSPDQAEALEHLLTQTAAVIRRATEEGRRDGASALRLLALGEITVDQLDRLTMGVADE